MPPLTPSRIRAIRGCYAGPGCAPGVGLRALDAVAVPDLARRQLLECDREVVASLGLDHGRRVLLVAALAEGAVIAVELPGALRGDQDGRVVRVGALQ